MLIGNHRHAIDRQASYTAYNPTALTYTVQTFRKRRAGLSATAGLYFCCTVWMYKMTLRYKNWLILPLQKVRQKSDIRGSVTPQAFGYWGNHPYLPFGVGIYAFGTIEHRQNLEMNINYRPCQ